MRSAKVRLVVTAVVLTIAGMVLIAAFACAIIVGAGWYDVGAITQHWQVSYSGVEAAMRYSVRNHARDVVAPPFTEPMVLRGAAVYERHCLQCHGAPGIAPNGIGLSMQPVPGPLVHMRRRWTTAQVYWIVSNGVKMTGMPAWRTRLSDDDLWAVTAFVARLPALSRQDYTALAAAARVAGATTRSLR